MKKLDDALGGHMKVENSVGNRPGLSGIPARDDVAVPETGGSRFQSKLLNAENQLLENQISLLAEKITAQGEKLAKKADIRELIIYKQLVSEFLNQVLGNTHRFSKRNFLDRRGRHRIYAIVRKVDEELEKLTEEILKAERDNLTILQKLDEIRGLILDLLL